MSWKSSKIVWLIPESNRAGNSRVAEAIVRGALLRIAQDAVGFGRLAKFVFSGFLLVGIAIRVPLHGRFAIGGLHLFSGAGLGDRQNFVVIAFVNVCHGGSVRCLRFARTLLSLPGRMHGDAHRARPQHAIVKLVSLLEHFHHGTVRKVGGFDAIERQ